MANVLVRSRKGPFDSQPPSKVFSRNLIGNNAGNLIFSQAVHRHVSVAGTTVDSNHFSTNPDKAEEINETYDAFVIPLANAFRVSFEEPLSKMTELISRLTIPVVVAGVGAQFDVAVEKPESLAGISESVGKFCRVVLDRSAKIGVRGEVTQEYMRKLGFGDEHVQVIGCPSIFMNGADLDVSKRVASLDPNSPISINISPYVRKMAPILAENRRRYRGLLYTAQDIHTLGLMLKDVPPPDVDLRSTELPYNGKHSMFKKRKVRFCIDPPVWFQYLSEFDFSFGTRIHGNIAALLGGTPAMVLAHDSRTLELAQYHEIPHKIISDDPSDFIAENLFEEVDLNPLLTNHQRKFDNYVDFLDANGVSHIFGESEAQVQGAAEFDSRLAATDFPPPLKPARLRKLSRENQDRVRAASRAFRGIGSK